MLELVVHVDAPVYMAQGVKESLCMGLEPYGAARVVSVRDLSDGPYQQERIPVAAN